MKVSTLIIALFFYLVTNAQNVGIGNATPGFPLNFALSFGDKISLYGNSGNHYGLGIQNGLLQIHSDASSSNIAFGYGTSNSFNERMQILNNGNYDGMSLNGRLVLKNGSNDPVGGGPGVWLYRADNTNLLGFLGAENNQNVGFYGGPAGWGFTYDAVHSRVGIGANDPAYLLDLNGRMRIRYNNGQEAGIWLNNSSNTASPAYLGMKNNNEVGFYGTTTGWGFAMNTDNGALSVNNNTGNNGQVLISSGNGAPPVWGDKFTYYQTAPSYSGSVNDEVEITSLTINLTKPSQVFLSYNICIESYICLGLCTDIYVNVLGKLNGTAINEQNLTIRNNKVSAATLANRQFSLAAGSHTFSITTKKEDGGFDYRIGSSTNVSNGNSTMSVIVVN